MIVMQNRGGMRSPQGETVNSIRKLSSLTSAGLGFILSSPRNDVHRRQGSAAFSGGVKTLIEVRFIYSSLTPPSGTPPSAPRGIQHLIASKASKTRFSLSAFSGGRG